jgi:hypothetical protein
MHARKRSTVKSTCSRLIGASSGKLKDSQGEASVLLGLELPAMVSLAEIGAGGGSRGSIAIWPMAGWCLSMSSEGVTWKD